MLKLLWRVKLAAKRRPGVTIETELACIERDAQAGLADLGLSLAEAKHLTARSVKNLGRYAASWIAGWPNCPSSTVAMT